MQQLKIMHGTPTSGKPLCDSCKYGHRRRGQNMEEEVFCSNYNFGGGDRGVPFKVAECSGFQPFNTPSLREMEDIAWLVTPRMRGGTGFTQNAVEDVDILPPKKRDNDILDE